MKAASQDADGVLLTRIFIESEDALRAFLTRFLKCQNDIDDALYEAYARTYRAMSSQDLDSPRAFLFRTAKNLALNELKRHSTQFESNFAELNIEDIACAEPSVEERLMEDQQRQLLNQAIEQLPKQCRKAFVLRKQHHFSHKSISEKLNISVRTVERHMANAVVKCSEYIKQSSQTHKRATNKLLACEKDQTETRLSQSGTP